MTTPLRARARTTCRAAFITSLLLFLALAVALVSVQLVGVLLLQPGWITWASDVLLTPSITAAVVFGLIGFASGYLVPATADAGE